MKLRTGVVFCIISLNSIIINVSAAEEHKTPSNIMCFPNEYKIVALEGIEDSDLRKPEMQLFQYGGKVKITKDGSNQRYSYESDGQDFFTIKEKYKFTKDLIDVKKYMYTLSRLDNPEKYILTSMMGNGFFHIDLKQKRYYGYINEFGEVHTYTGTCSVVSDR
ncbi:hypothetical protein ACI77J_06220 [Pseudomonas sp. O64]|uniref:hypothetical protein n=1 Tax=unclassified Pseudomonas TaxID=196821 RepID=UPI00387A9B36